VFYNVVQGWARVALLALLALWAALLVGGFAVGARPRTAERRMPRWTRMASSLVLVAGAWSWLAIERGGPTAEYALLVALGMTLGCAGDLALAGLLPLRAPVLGGIAAFGLGHVAYILALLRFGDAHGLAAPAPRFGALVAALALGALGWYLVVARGRRRTALHWAALPYALLLACSAGLAAGLALQADVFLPATLGGLLFLASDLLLAGQLFSGLDFPLIGDIIWLTYGPAQALLVYGINAAMLALLTHV
jgi:YhhN family